MIVFLLLLFSAATIPTAIAQAFTGESDVIKFIMVGEVAAAFVCGVIVWIQQQLAWRRIDRGWADFARYAERIREMKGGLVDEESWEYLMRSRGKSK